MIYRTAPFSMTLRLERLLPPVSRSRYSLTMNVSETVRDTDIVSMEIHIPYSTMSSLSDFE